MENRDNGPLLSGNFLIVPPDESGSVPPCRNGATGMVANPAVPCTGNETCFLECGNTFGSRDAGRWQSPGRLLVSASSLRVRREGAIGGPDRGAKSAHDGKKGKQ